MKLRWPLGLGLLLALGLGARALWPSSRAAPTWRLGTVERTDVRARVSTTGSLSAVTTVEVGTQVSGVVQELLADFNEPVRQGQVLARLDPSLLQADVRAARAQLGLRRAERDQAQAELRRAELLAQRQAISDQELLAARTALAVAEAALTSARINLERAQQDLSYATILSPIDGTVLARDVEEGQTVNAGMSAPRLFLLAGDLRRMRILANVDEADIGRVHEGQPVEFTVAAFGSERFQGRVQQVRLQSTLTENVVTYTVVVEVDNEALKLRPGMTATVEIIVAEAPGVLCAPNAALRFRPDAALIEGGAEPAEGAAVERGRSGRRGEGGRGRLWLPAGPGRVRALPVTTGLTDGRCTAVEGEGVEEGLQVVTGQEVEDGGAGAIRSPLAPSGSAGAGPRPGGGHR